MTTRRLHVERAGVGHLAVVRAWLADACSEAGVNGASRDALVLAADELCANVVIHGYEGSEPGPITLTFEGDGAAAVVTITDAARPFDPGTLRPPDLSAPAERRQPGGLGWHFVRHSVDEVHVQSVAEGGNRITLVKRLRAAART